MSGGHGHDADPHHGAPERRFGAFRIATVGLACLGLANIVPVLGHHVRNGEAGLVVGGKAAAGAIGDGATWASNAAGAFGRFFGHGSLDPNSAVTTLVDCSPDNNNPLTRKSHIAQSPLFRTMVLGGNAQTRRGDGTKNAVAAKVRITPQEGGFVSIDRDDLGPARAVPGVRKAFQSAGVQYSILTQADQSVDITAECMSSPSGSN